MPFFVYLTKNLDAQRLADKKKPDVLTRADLDKALDLLSAFNPLSVVRRHDGSLWVFREGMEKPCEEPWCQMRFDPRGRGETGVIELSISFRYHHFPLNVFTLLRSAAFVAENFNFRAYEMSGKNEVSVDNVEEVAGEDSPLMNDLIKFWKKGQGEIDPGKMLFELPSGGADRGDTAAGFRLKFPRPVPMAEVFAPPSEAMLVQYDATRAVLIDHAANEALVYASLVEGTDQEVFIWPGWRMDAPFTEIFGQTLAAAQRAQARLDGELRWMGDPWSREHQSWLDRHPKLLSVELFEYVFEEREPRPRERWVRKDQAPAL